MFTKKKSLKVNILKKINQRIRIEFVDDSFIVEHKIGGAGEWIKLNSYSTFKAALNKKHSYIVMIILRDLSYRNEFVKRRTKRKE
jgi:hypothetical protein